MLVVFIARIKHKVLKGLRFGLVLTILAILLVQLVGVVKSLNFHLDEKIPSGNPMRVSAPASEVCDDEMEHGFLEKFIEQLLKPQKDEK